ncbi:MAG: DNA-protecting protein DprA [Candidatus Wildermuthbacteria bacterium]|nr:DNA-protecting protein DprA [Candidatus Wildermuthbacteria bacterium]
MSIVKEQKEYPALLRELGDAPKQLYYKGNWDVSLFEKCLAVVGTRRITSYGRRVTEELVGEIAAQGITIVSGFMYGIDATAHKAALRVGGKTIAVMPCGIDMVHPSDQLDLYKEILDTGGLVLSEYEGNFKPLLWTYPKRNRIVAGLSQATLVVEAGEKSGSLITANFAKKYKRKLFAVPGPLTSSVSVGIMQLIREGASVVGCAKDILDFYRSNLGFSLRFTPPAGWGPTRLPAGQAGLQKNQDSRSSPLEAKIVEQLRREPLEADELARALEVNISKLGTALSLMQLSGIIGEEGGKYHAY